MTSPEMEFCYKYPRPAFTVDAIVVAGNHCEDMLLLVQRKYDPFAGKWALPGGFFDLDETLEEACKRELFEETGVKNVALQQFFTFDAINRDPRHRTITTVFHGRLPEPIPVTGGDDAVAARWFPIISLPEMAFDHADIIRKFVKEKF